MQRNKRVAIFMLVIVSLLFCVPSVFATATARSTQAVATTTPLATSTPPPTPLSTSTAAPTPVISFATPAPMPSQEDFFGSDDRSSGVDYDNPAYNTVDQQTSAKDDTTGYIGDLLKDNAETMDIVILLTLLALIPSILIMLTGFTRIVIVLSFVRNAMGTQNMPPNQVIVGLALFLTFFLMFPVLSTIQKEALDPYVKEEITIEQATERAIEPLRDFMLKQTYKDDLNLFVEISNTTATEVTDIPIHVLIPAFIISEIKHAFLLGFFIYIPFIVIDMIVASTLMSMGMMMLPPVMISLPFKILLFVSVDGWNLLIGTLLRSFK